MDDRLLDKFFKGQCSEQEKQQIFLWFLSDQAEKSISDKIEAIWQEDKTADRHWRKADTLKVIHEKIREAEENKAKALHPWYHRWQWRYAAAAVLVLMVISGWWYNQKKGVTKTEVVSVNYIVSKQTKKGEQKMITMADGTKVKLNVDSRIWYSQNYGAGGEREVFLEGEAFFDVVRDTLRPFLVHTGGVETAVLGTSFNVNAYYPDESVTVSVVTGKVKVQQTQKPMPAILIEPNEQAVYSVTDSVLLQYSYDSSKVLSWTEGTLYFSNASFEEIEKTLERWYGVEIEVKRKIEEDGFSGAYTKRSLESVLSGIGFVLHFDYEIQGNKVVIK